MQNPHLFLSCYRFLRDELRIGKFPFSANGRTLTLSDVAEIKRGYQDPQQISMRFKGKPVIGLGVVMAPGGNVQTLGKALEGAMAEG